jgi:hypothetical protein
MAFTEGFGRFASTEDRLTTKVGKFTVTARIVHDEDSGAPWDNEDGHGPVSGWTSRKKRPGERILCEDHGSYRLYDVQEAIELAKRDGWDTKPYQTGTAGERAVRAVEADYRYLRGWCRDEWCYCGIVLSVTHTKTGIELEDNAASLWGIECNVPGSDNSHLLEVANELLPEAVELAKKLHRAVKA